MNTSYIHILTKRALKGDLESLMKLFSFLENYNIPIARYGMYSLLYQFVMNNVLDSGKYCEQCGGKCCKSGLPVPVYDFDLKELKLKLRKEEIKNISRINGIHVLSRPCVFQQGWLCTIHEIKPYACMSYPFATEDEQKSVIESYTDGVPNFVVPDFCITGKKVKEFLDSIAKEMRKELGRNPSPREMLERILKIKKNI